MSGPASRSSTERIEPPAPGRISRIVASAPHSAEVAWSVRIASRLSPETTQRHPDVAPHILALLERARRLRRSLRGLPSGHPVRLRPHA